MTTFTFFLNALRTVCRGLSLVCSGHKLLIDSETGTQSFQDGYLLNIISIKAHEEYDDRRYINDIALVFAEV